MRNRSIDIILYKVYADIKAEAARSYLGLIWWVLDPALYMSVFYIIFTFVFHRGGAGFVPFLLCGLVAWKWFGSAVMQGTNAIAGNAGLMQQVYIPKYIFPSIIVLTNTIKFLPVFLILLCLLIGVFHGPYLSWVSLPVLLMVQMLLITSIVWLLASITPFFPDLRLVVSNFLTMLFFMSGIFYDISKLSQNIQVYFNLNPMAVLINQYHAVLLLGTWPDWMALGGVMLVSVAMLAVAYYVLCKYDRTYPKVLI